MYFLVVLFSCCAVLLSFLKAAHYSFASSELYDAIHLSEGVVVLYNRVSQIFMTLLEVNGGGIKLS